MELTINHPEINQLAHELMSYTNETLNQILLTALKERLKREKEKVIDDSVYNSPRVLGLHNGEGWISDDFNEPLPKLS